MSELNEKIVDFGINAVMLYLILLTVTVSLLVFFVITDYLIEGYRIIILCLGLIGFLFIYKKWSVKK